jgi:hypothetical protein
MPAAQTMFIYLNRLFAPETIHYLSPYWFDGTLTGSDLDAIVESVRRETIPGDLNFISTFSPGPVTLGQLARVFAVAKDSWQAGFIDSIPGGLRQSLMALIHHNLMENPRLPITWAWAPGYDYELSLWECAGTELSPGGITVFLRTRYPLDPHPKDL